SSRSPRGRRWPPEQRRRPGPVAAGGRNAGCRLEALGDRPGLVQAPDDRKALLDQLLRPPEVPADHDCRGEGAKASRDELRRPADPRQRERFFAPLDRRVDVAERELDQAKIVRGGRGVEGRAELDRQPATLVVEVSRAIEVLTEEGDVAEIRQDR